MLRVSLLSLSFLFFAPWPSTSSAAGNMPAIFTASFPAEREHQSLRFFDQNSFFAAENSNENSFPKKRPIWLHSGDSLSTAWGNRSSLGELINKSFQPKRAQGLERESFGRLGTLPDKSHFQLFSSLPRVPSYEYYVGLAPDERYTWYAGSHLRGGLLGALERQSEKEWVLYSTARVGAFLGSPRNPLLNLIELPQEHEHRVQLMTLSLGGNDICAGRDPFASQREELEERILKVLERFPDAQKIAFKSIDPVDMYQRLSSAIDEVPDATQREALRAYCQAAWLVNCPTAFRHADSPEGQDLESIIYSIDSFLSRHFSIVDIMKDAQQVHPFDLLSEDCFHPSREAQALILESLQESLDKKRPTP